MTKRIETKWGLVDYEWTAENKVVLSADALNINRVAYEFRVQITAVPEHKTASNVGSLIYRAPNGENWFVQTLYRKRLDGGEETQAAVTALYHTLPIEFVAHYVRREERKEGKQTRLQRQLKELDAEWVQLTGRLKEIEKEMETIRDVIDDMESKPTS